MLCFLFIAALPNAATADYVRIKGSVVNVRQGPGTTHPVLFQAEQGEEFDLVRTEGLWCLVKLDTGQDVWVFTKLVDIIQGTRPGAATGEKVPEKPAGPSSAWTRYIQPVLLILFVLLTALGVWKRREFRRFAEYKLKEISGYKREQAFRYDNRKPSDDSWEL